MADYPCRFGKYVLLRPLARGGMGEICLAAGGEIGGFEKLCVIKRVLSEKADAGKANRFQDEAKVVLRLSHANLVTTFDAGEVDDEFYIAMELVEGKDLREVWNRCVRTRTRIPLDVALHVVREVARALAYVHGYGDLHLVHRDVAPPNILLSYFGEVKLTDFGLARSVLKQEHTAPGVVFGRAAYLAPEQARGEIADARTDVYTLGIVLWELLTGQQLLQVGGVDPVTALAVVRHPKVLPPSHRAPWVSSKLDAVVMRALAPDRNVRFQSAEEMRKALADVMAETAPRADTERVGHFLHELYGAMIAEERAERERLLEEGLARFRAGPERTVSAVESSRRPTAPRLPPAASEVAGAEAAERAGWPAPTPSPAARRTASRPPPIPSDAAGERRKVVPVRSRTAAPTGGTAPATATAAVGFIGRVIDGRYRIIRQIGEGGMGTVYAGEHVEIGKGVAVKILHPACSTQQDLVERFRREARAASKIGHPNIVDVTDFGTTEEGCAYFVMEQLEGIDLADVLAHERRIEPGRAVQIGVQICRAVQAAHVAGIIHRDLKPENIFLVAREGEADFVKVLDFGIARSTSGDARKLTNPGIAMGTPEYMAPEQARGKPADARADVYAVGAMLYEMVTGVPPHSGSSFIDILNKKNNETPRPPRELRPELSEDLERVIVESLERDPDRRPQTMAQLEYALTKSVRGRGLAVAALLGIHEPAAGLGMNASTSVTHRGRNTRDAVDRVPTELSRSEPSLAVGKTAAERIRAGAAWAASAAGAAPTWVDAETTQTDTRLPPVLPDASRAEVPLPATSHSLPSESHAPSAESPAPVAAAPAVAIADAPGRSTAARRSPAGLGFGIAFAVLVAAVSGSVAAYRRVGWLRGEQGWTPPPARPAAVGTKSPTGAPRPPESAADAKARRIRELAAEVDRQLRAERIPSSAQPAIEAALGKLGALDPVRAGDVRRTGAESLAARAEQRLPDNVDQALEDLRVARMLDPASPRIAGQLARALTRSGRRALAEHRPEDAVARLREAFVLAPGDAGAGTALGEALAATKDWAGAATAYKEVLENHPRDAKVKKNLAKVKKLASGRRKDRSSQVRGKL